MMAFSALSPRAGTLAENALEISGEGGLIGEAALSCDFRECQPRGQQEVLYGIYAPFHEPTVRRPPERPPKRMGEMAYR